MIEENVLNKRIRYRHGEELCEAKIRNLHEMEFRILIVKIMKELRNRMDAQSEKLEVFNKELENLNNSQTIAWWAIVHGDSPGKNTVVGFYALLQGIFSTQGSNPGLLHCKWILYNN